jgi:predicted ribonuclease YlaK
MSWLPDLDSVCQALAGSLPVAEEVVVDGGSSADAGGSLFIHPVVPKNARQRAALHWLYDARTPLVFLLGPAGCGKTALAVAAAARGLDLGLYDRILLARVNVGTGNDIGFLPGSPE